MTFAVLRRRMLLGTLRTLGVTRGQLFALVLGEAMLFALVGGLLGLAAGIGVGWGLVQLVTRTISDIYFAMTVSGLFVSPWSLLKGAALGMLVTLAAALGPALEAAASQPRDVLRRHRIEHHGGRLLPGLALAGIGLMLAGLAMVQVPGQSLGLGFVALFAVVVGFSLCVPLGLKLLARLLGPLFGLAGPQGRLAGRGLVASISRTGVAAAALTVAVSATVGVGIMIDSFRGSVAAWLENTLASDLYVSAPSASSGLGDGNLPPGLGEVVAALPGVAEVSKGRSARIEARNGPVALLALEASLRSRRGFRWLGETVDDLWPRFEAGELVLISEPYAFHQGFGPGDRVALFTREGWRDFQVGAVFQDYGSDSGMLVMARGTYAALWGDPGVTTLGVSIAEGAASAAVLERLRTLVAGYPAGVEVVDEQSIRETSLEVFDRTFVITRVLRLLAVGVAFVGVLSALLALQLERAREHAILRATGMTPGQLGALILLQTGTLGLAAGLLALPLGWMMGGLLIEVVNVRSFGWTMSMAVPPSALVSGVALALAAALIAGLYPALRSARTDPAAALREE
jgi:putative ABC transport system permease protein